MGREQFKKNIGRGTRGKGNTGVTYKIWIEDAESINLKSSLVHKYNLAGAAAWRRGFETEDIWPVIAQNLKETDDYSQWAQANK
jgi:hypothetical protein